LTLVKCMTKNSATIAYARALLHSVVSITLLTIAVGQINPPQPRTQGDAPPDVPRQLELGRTIKGELAEGRTDSFLIAQYVRVSYLPPNFGTTVKLLSSGKEALVGLHLLSGGLHEPLYWVAKTSGQYRVEVSPREEVAGSPACEMTLEELRPAKPEDQDRITAQSLFGEARAHIEKHEYQLAIPQLERAPQLSRSVKDRDREETALANIGGVYAQIGQPRRALEFFNQALPIMREVGNRRGEARALNYIGSVYEQLGPPQKALEFHNQALPIAREVGDRRGEGSTLMSIGNVYGRTGEPQKALEFYNQALPILREVGNHEGEGGTLDNIGNVYRNIGQSQKALEFYNQALAITQKGGDRRHEAAALTNIGNIYRYTGQPQTALEFYHRALPIFREVGDRRDEAATLKNIGAVYHNTGQPQKALIFYNQALLIEREVSARHDEAYTLISIGVVYRNAGKPQKAVELYNQGLRIMREMGDRDGEAITLGGIGDVYSGTGQQQGAGDSLQLYLAALQLAEIAGNPDLQGRIDASLMHYWTERNESLAVFFGKAAVNNYQQIRGNMRGLDKELQAGFAQSKSQSYRQLAELLAQQGRLTEAEQVLNLLKEAEYFDFVRRDSTESATLTQHADLTPAEAELEKRYREIGDKLIALGTERGAMLSKKDSHT